MKRASKKVREIRFHSGKCGRIICVNSYAEQEYGVCTKKENTGLAELVDGVVTDLKDSGKLAEMIKDWGIE